MVPKMALAASAAHLKLGGKFMALVLSAQSAAMCAAMFVGGLMISPNAQEPVQTFWINAVIGVVATVLSLILAKRPHLCSAAPGERVGSNAAKVVLSPHF